MCVEMEIYCQQYTLLIIINKYFRNMEVLTIQHTK